MQMNFKQLPMELKKRLAPIYLITGDVPQLINEARLLIQKAAVEANFHQRELLQIEPGFDWSKFIAFTQNYGLFGDKSLIEILNPQAKFDEFATQAIINYVDNQQGDHVVVIVTNKLPASEQKKNWYKVIQEKGVVIPIWPLSSSEIPAWIREKFKEKQLNADTESIQLLAELTENNLLATIQSIEKIKLLCPNKNISRSDVMMAVSDNARYNIFDLCNYLLQGNSTQIIRIFTHLRQENTEPILILWAMVKEIRHLIHLKIQMEAGTPLSILLQKEWSQKKTFLQKALTRLTLKELNNLLQLSMQIDLSIKGIESYNVWDTLMILGFGFAGLSPQKNI